MILSGLSLTKPLIHHIICGTVNPTVVLLSDSCVRKITLSVVGAGSNRPTANNNRKKKNLYSTERLKECPEESTCDFKYYPTPTASNAHRQSLGPDHLNDIPRSRRFADSYRCMSLVNTRYCTANSGLLVVIGVEDQQKILVGPAHSEGDDDFNNLGCSS